MDKDVELSEQSCNAASARVVMLEAFVNALKDRHAPAVVLLSHAIRHPHTIETQNAILMNASEVGLLNQVARNDFVMSGFGIVVQALFFDNWSNLVAIQTFHALH